MTFAFTRLTVVLHTQDTPLPTYCQL